MQVPRTEPDRPVLIAGPTASGKSALATEIAARQGGVIVNADAAQVFACWRVLTARPSPSDEARLPHRLYGHVPATQRYSVGNWLREIAPLLCGAHRPIVVGGTGLYFSALTGGLAGIPPTPPEIRAEAEKRLEDAGARALAQTLDEPTRMRIDTANPARVRRAWEVLRTTGDGLAAWQDATPAPLLPLQETQAFVLVPEPAWLAGRIAQRFDAMLTAGALEEVRAARACIAERWPAAKVLGATDLAAHLAGEVSLATAREAAITATRRYAKRQRTWFRSRMAAWHPILLP